MRRGFFVGGLSLSSAGRFEGMMMEGKEEEREGRREREEEGEGRPFIHFFAEGAGVTRKKNQFK